MVNCPWPFWPGAFLYIWGMTKLDEIMTANNLVNHALVEAMPGHLNHKMVQKARLGKKPVPRHTQDLIVEALNIVLAPETKYRRENLF